MITICIVRHSAQAGAKITRADAHTLTKEHITTVKEENSVQGLHGRYLRAETEASLLMTGLACLIDLLPR
jgi:hypothetical protein